MAGVPKQIVRQVTAARIRRRMPLSESLSGGRRKEPSAPPTSGPIRELLRLQLCLGEPLGVRSNSCARRSERWGLRCIWKRIGRTHRTQQGPLRDRSGRSYLDPIFGETFRDQPSDVGFRGEPFIRIGAVGITRLQRPPVARTRRAVPSPVSTRYVPICMRRIALVALAHNPNRSNANENH